MTALADVLLPAIGTPECLCRCVCPISEAAAIHPELLFAFAALVLAVALASWALGRVQRIRKRVITGGRPR